MLSEYDEEVEALREKIEAESDRYNYVDQLDSHESFRIMEDFAQSLPESTFKERLFDALGRNRPFRRFKDIVHEDLALRDHWFAFHKEAMTLYALDWLHACGIEPEWTSQADMV